MENWSGTGRRGDHLLLDAFLPALLRQRIALNSSPAPEPVAERFPAAVLLADLSGFSALAESFAQRGPRGAEDLRDLLNLFFGRLVDLVHAHGGQVLSFPGDAALALWPIADGDDAAAARLAVQCALAAQEAFDRTRPSEARMLRLRAGVGIGQTWAANVGGIANRWHFVIAGEPLRQAIRAIAMAVPGDVIASAEVWNHIASEGTGSPRGPDGVLVEAVTLAARDDRLSDVAPASVCPDSLLRLYVPRAVQARIDAGQTDWLAEFRRVTVLFINVGTIDCEETHALEPLQRATTIVQTLVDRYGGSINQLLADEKGTVVACGWGLAQHAHADDAVRAVRAAVEIRRELRAAGLGGGSFGIATGEVFTGLRGNRERCDYAMIGTVVNLSARLMQAAGGEILGDVTSMEAVAKRVQLQLLAPLALKGFDHEVEVCRFLDLKAEESSEMLGRVSERRALVERLDALVSSGRGSVVMVEGDAGIGKSRLLRDVVERAVSRGVRIVLTAGDAIERSAPYHVWRALFDDVLRREGLGSEQGIASLLESEPQLLPFAPLLNPVLGLKIEETERSRNVTPRGRALLTRDLLVHLFRRAVGNQPTLVVLDDTHWFDSASWALAEGIQREMPRLLLLIAMRPVPHDDSPPELLRLSAREGTLCLRLEALTPEASRDLACQRLRARVLDPSVEQLILHKAEGHPFFTEELAHALYDLGLVRVDRGVCRFTGTRAAAESMLLPSSVRVMVSSRIDQLTVPQQLTLKVASVLGRSFDLSSLGAIYPIDTDAEDLARHLAAVVDHDLIRLTSLEPNKQYEFKHAIIQEVAYSLLPYAQRRKLHAEIARRYERAGNDNLGSFYPLLAHHWSHAEVADKAVFYLDKAGEQALGRFANEEAVRFYREAVEMEERVEQPAMPDAGVHFSRRIVPARDVRRIRWQRRLGDAYTNMGKWLEARGHFERALTMLGQPVPTSTPEYWVGLATELCTQLSHRVLPRRPARHSNETAALLREAVCAYERMGALMYFSERLAPLFYSLVAALNRAEQLGPTSELALVYADVGNIVGIMPVHGLAWTYNRMARRTAENLGDSAVSAKVLGRSSVYRIAVGDWSACADLDTSMALCTEVGDPYQWEESAAIRTRASHLLGEFHAAERLGAEIQRRASASGSAAHEVWGIDGQVWGLMYLGRHQSALDLAGAGLRVLATAKRHDRVPTLDFLGALALGHAYRGERDSAREAAHRIAKVMEETSSRPGHLAVLGISAAAETYVTLWEAQGDGDMSRTAAEAFDACRRLQGYGRFNPPARARGLLWRGCAEWLSGRQDVAHESWQRCLREAARFALPYETARVHYEIGRHRAPADPGRRAHLLRAEEGFRTLHADFELTRVAALLSSDESTPAVV